MSLTNNDRLYEQYEDALFEWIMNEVAEAEGEKLLRENEELMKQSSTTVPDSLTKRCLKTIEKSYAKNRYRQIGRAAAKVINKVAIVALISSLLFVCVLATSEEARRKTINFLEQYNEQVLSISFSEQTLDVQSNENSAIDIARKALANQCVETYEIDYPDIKSVCFENENGDEIGITESYVGDGAGQLQFDTENSIVTTELILDETVKVIEKDSEITFIWSNLDDQTVIDIYGPCTERDMLIKIIASIIETLK